MGTTSAPFAIEFYDSPDGDRPVMHWINAELSVARRRAVGYALWRVLEQLGVEVCGTEWGHQLGGGLFEFRIRTVAAGESRPMVLRIFCHSRPGRRILLLGAYDKGADASPRRQRREIELARRRLAEFLSR